MGAVAGCWVCVVDCELAVRVVQTGCGCWVLVLGAVSWLCAWWRVETGCRVLAVRACRCWVLVLAVRVADTGCRRVAGVRCVRGADWVLVPGAGAGCARSGDTPRCIACKYWSCCQCRVQPRKIFCVLLLSGVYAGVIFVKAAAAELQAAITPISMARVVLRLSATRRRQDRQKDVHISKHKLSAGTARIQSFTVLLEGWVWMLDLSIV